MSSPRFLLRELSAGTRVALALASLVLLGGYVASGLYLVEHHQNRDDREGLTLTDIEGVYHGVTSDPILQEVLAGGHPEEIEGAPAVDPEDRAFLLEWLSSDTVAEDWNNIDLGDGYGSPEEVVQAACGSCHARSAPAEKRAEPPLDFFDDVKELAIAREVNPTSATGLLASTHAHSLAMGTMTVVVVLLAALTGWPAWIVGLFQFLAAAGLLLDLSLWWIARAVAGLAPLIVAAGTAHAVGICALLVLILLELPRRVKG